MCGGVKARRGKRLVQAWLLLLFAILGMHRSDESCHVMFCRFNSIESNAINLFTKTIPGSKQVHRWVDYTRCVER